MAFSIFLSVLIFLPSTCLNAVSQSLLLVLLLIYLSSGIRRLLKLWPIIMFYQAFVLILVIGFQFTIAIPQI